MRIIIQVMRIVITTQAAAAPPANPPIKGSFDGVFEDEAHVALLERQRNGFPSYLYYTQTYSSSSISISRYTKIELVSFWLYMSTVSRN